MKVQKRIDLELLTRELTAASVSHGGLGLTGSDTDGELFQWTAPDANGSVQPLELPPAAVPVVEAHTAPPRAVEFVGSREVGAVLRTTDDAEHDVFVFPAEVKSLYRATLTMTAIDAGNGAIKTMEGRMVFKRLSGNVIAPPGNITVVSDIHDTAAASWIMNALPSGTTIRIFVKGAAGRTIDWSLVGSIGRFAPEGLE